MASGLIPGCQIMSDLLTIREKGCLLALLEPRCQLIKTTVAQVLQATETSGEEQCWESLGCGVVCLVKDESVCSYFLRLYCVKSAKLLWEQELYIPFKYNATRAFFHTFLADARHTGLNFANEAEAEEFYLIMEAIQKEQETTVVRFEITNAEEEESSTSEAANSGIQPLDSDEELPASIEDPYANVTLGSREWQKWTSIQTRQTKDQSDSSQEAPQGSGSQIPPWIPLPPLTAAPVIPERKSVSFTCSKK